MSLDGSIVRKTWVSEWGTKYSNPALIELLQRWTQSFVWS